MEREIERKFLPKRLPDRLADFAHKHIEQGYLALESHGEVQVRLRRAGEELSLTFKCERNGRRYEIETALSAEQFDTLWPATEGRRLSKTRYDIPWRSSVIELDIYRGRLAGLIVAEVEFEDEQSRDAFEPPDWFDREVTGEAQYSNVLLALGESTVVTQS